MALLRHAGLPVPDNFTPYYMVVSSRDNRVGAAGDAAGALRCAAERV